MKKTKHYIVFLVVAIIFLVVTGNISAQTPAIKFKFEKDEILEELDCLKEDICPKIDFPDEFESACVLALSYYPELKNENIEFVYSKGSYSMAARPAPLSLLKSKKKRVYRIFINTESKNQGLLLHQVPFNAQVGIIGHEFAHVLDYTKKSSFRIILDGIGYLSKKYRAKLEKATDKEAIDRGLGWQLHDFSHKTQTSEEVPDDYKIYKTKIYMCPQTILNYIEGQKLPKVE